MNFGWKIRCCNKKKYKMRKKKMHLLKWKKIIKNNEKNKIISDKKNKWNVNLNEFEEKIKKKFRKIRKKY